jgi:LDH2 family malate/lactate/ureidoglycolate dehydrogenase
MLLLSADDLRATATEIFRAAGAEPDPTEILVDHLIDANLAGHDSHGVLRIPSYVKLIQSGRIQPNNRPFVVRETAVSAIVDGNQTFGQVSARFGTEVAVAKAKGSGVGVVGIVRCNNIGRLGTYSSLAARDGVVFMVTTGGLGKSVAPFGGRRGAFGTNPFSFGFPAGERPDLMIDFATSTIAGGKVMVARAKHEPVPPGSLIDREGNPTTDPNEYFNGGALLPFGGHKGSALATLSVLLANALVPVADYPGGSGTFMLAVNADILRDVAAVEREADAALARIKDVPPAAGGPEVLVAGEPEVRAAQRRRAEGIPVAEDTWAEIVAAAKSVGVSLQDRSPMTK